MAKTIHTDKAPAAIGPYVQGKIVGNLLFASGQVPLSPETGEIIGETIQEQTEQVLKNVGAILAEAGTDFDHVVKTTCFLSDINDFVPFMPKEESVVISDGRYASEVLSDGFETQPAEDGSFTLPGVVSRKKQFIPALMTAYQEL